MYIYNSRIGCVQAYALNTACKEEFCLINPPLTENGITFWLPSDALHRTLNGTAFCR